MAGIEFRIKLNKNDEFLLTLNVFNVHCDGKWEMMHFLHGKYGRQDFECQIMEQTMRGSSLKYEFMPGSRMLDN